MNTYNLSKKAKYVIYGASHLGRNIKESLGKQGIKADCFLDEKYNRINQIDELPVCNPENYNYGDCVYIIAKSNPHSAANMLFEKGITKIIFNPPLYKKTENDYINKMVNAYLMVENTIDFDVEIPFYDPKYMDNRFEDASFINRIGDEVLAYIPTDMLFVKNDEQHIYIKYAYLIECLRGIDGKNTDLSFLKRYIEEDYLTELFDRRFDRPSDKLRYIQELYNCYNMRLIYSMNWFEKEPIKVEYVDNKFFVEKGDVFQIAFLITKGIIRIPALINEKDYLHWVNEGALSLTIQCSNMKNMLVSYTPLEHPFFFDFPAARDVCGSSRILHICKWLLEEGIEVKNKRVIDIGAYYGFFSRFFARLGAKVTLVEANERSFSFCNQFNRLMRMEDINMYCGEIENLEVRGEYDICLLLTVLYWHYKDTIGLRILNVVDKVTKEVLLWESGDQIEEEKEWIMNNSSFKHYEKIAETVGTGKIRELGVFRKNK